MLKTFNVFATSIRASLPRILLETCGYNVGHFTTVHFCASFFAFSFCFCFFRFSFFLSRCRSSAGTSTSRFCISSCNSPIVIAPPSSSPFLGFRAARAASTAASYRAFNSSNQTSVTVCSHSSRKSLSYQFCVNSFMAFSFDLASSVLGRGISCASYSSCVWYSSSFSRMDAASCFDVIWSCSFRLASDRSFCLEDSSPRRSALAEDPPAAYLLVRPDPPVCFAPPPRILFELLRASDIFYMLLPNRSTL
mmetsp:Transcript_42910/g.43490  ORF Transcript_42910/g.43490 Transcript_42910/m.43490 type:complete len:250 (+) Transcript_42910:279-1028(+)